jgi:hypothetical protein
MSKGTPFTREIVDRLDDLETDIDAAVVAIEAAATDIESIANVFLGTITVGGSTTEWAIEGLDGKGDHFFLGGAWYAFMFYTTDSAAPIGEWVAITDYTSTGGVFTSAAFTEVTTAGDKLYIVPYYVHDVYIAAVAIDTALGDMDDTPTNTNLSDITTTSAHAKLSRLLTDYTNGRAGYLDELSEANIPADVDSIKGYTHHLYAVTDGASSNLASANVVDGSIIAKLASKTALGAAPEAFDCTTDSLEAISDAVAAVTSESSYNRYGDRLYFDSVQGSAGTAWPIGVAQSPASNVANLQTIAGTTKIKSIGVRGIMTLGQSWEGYDFHGQNLGAATEYVALGGQDVDSSSMYNLIVTGTQAGTGALSIMDGVASSITDFYGSIKHSAIAGYVYLKDATYAALTDCNAAWGAITIKVQAPTWCQCSKMTGEYTLDLQDGGTVYFESIGQVNVTNMTSGTLYLIMNGGRVSIAATCVGGTIVISGIYGVIANSTGGTTVTDNTINGSLGNTTNNMGDVTGSETGDLAEYFKFFREVTKVKTQTRIGLIVPDLANIASDTDNATLYTQLSLISIPNYIDQTGVDAGKQDWLVYDMIVVGSDKYAAFTTSNLDDLITLKVPVLVCNSPVAAFMKLGTAAADGDSSVDEYVQSVANRTTILDFAAVGNATLFSPAATSDRLDMSDAQLSEQLLMTNLVGDSNTTAVVGWLPAANAAGTAYTLDDASDIPAGRVFAGCFNNADNLTTLGLSFFKRVCRNLALSSLTASITVNANAAKLNDIDTDLGEPNDATTDTVHGKIGTDTEMNDVSLYDMLKYYLHVTDGAASTLAAANVADGSIVAKIVSKTANGAAPENFNCTTDSLEALSDKLGAFTGDGGTDQNDSVLADLNLINDLVDGLETAVGTSADTHATTTSLHGVLDKVYDAVITVDDYVDAEITTLNTNCDKKVTGRIQTFSKAITSAANAGDVTLATATTQKVLVHGLTLRSNGATTANLTNIAIYAATGKRVTLLTPAQGVLANLAADGNQVSISCGSAGVELDAAETIVATLTGTGATAVALTAYFTYSAVVDGGYLA